MQKMNDGGMRPQSTDRNEKYRAVVSGLASLVGHVRKCLELIDEEIASESGPEEPSDENIIVLDDMSSGFACAQVALQESEAGLSAALHLLQGSMPERDRMCEFAA